MGDEPKKVYRARRHLTEKQKKFVEAYLANGGNASAALRDAGFSAKNAKNYCAKILRIPVVALAISNAQKKLAERMADRTLYNRERAVDEINDYLQIAKASKNTMAAAKLLELKTKLHGLLIEKHDHRMAAGFKINIMGMPESPLPAPAIEAGESNGTVLPKLVDFVPDAAAAAVSVVASKTDGDADDIF